MRTRGYLEEPETLSAVGSFTIPNPKKLDRKRIGRQIKTIFMEYRPKRESR